MLYNTQELLKHVHTVPPISVVVHEPAPHAGARTDCEYRK